MNETERQPSCEERIDREKQKRMRWLFAPLDGAETWEEER